MNQNKGLPMQTLTPSEIEEQLDNVIDLHESVILSKGEGGAEYAHGLLINSYREMESEGVAPLDSNFAVKVKIERNVITWSIL